MTQDLRDSIDADDLSKEELEQLFGGVLKRLRTLVTVTLNGFPNVRRWDDTDDVLATVSLRLLKQLRKGDIHSRSHFYNLAAKSIRWTLIDLARKHAGAQSFAANHDSLGGVIPELYSQKAKSDTGDPAKLVTWTEFHEAVALLPEKQREVVDFIWYHGLSVGEVAVMVALTDSAVRKRWRDARLALYDLCQQQAPV